MSDKPMTSSAADQIAPEPRARTASPAREDASEARRGSHSQRHSEVSAIIANANRDLARKASALSATLAAMDEAASIAAHNTRVDAERGEAPHEDRLRAQPDTPPEKVDAAPRGPLKTARRRRPIRPPTRGPSRASQRKTERALRRCRLRRKATPAGVTGRRNGA